MRHAQRAGERPLFLLRAVGPEGHLVGGLWQLGSEDGAELLEDEEGQPVSRGIKVGSAAEKFEAKREAFGEEMKAK